VLSVDKRNVLATSQLWRETVEHVARDFPDVALSHMLIDRAAMELMKGPANFDVILTENTFGDILSDEAAAVIGSIGSLPSASIGIGKNTLGHAFGLYEPISGSAPDISGLGHANPVGAMLSCAMLLQYSFSDDVAAERIRSAVTRTFELGWCTPDISAPHFTQIDTESFTQKVLDMLVSREHVAVG
jgi:3-isopropylmalate dehydrogenase